MIAEPIPQLGMRGEIYGANSSHAANTYAFGPFTLDTSRRLLLRGSQVTPIPERLFQVLLLLIVANGSVVDKETLASTVWPDCAVSDGNLAQHVYMLRQLLRERAKDHSYIMTVAGKGYRFAVPVSVLPAAAELVQTPVVSRPEPSYPGGVDGFQQYCEGSYLLEQRTLSTVRRGIDCFEAALRCEPESVPALIGLGRAHAFLGEYCYVPGSHAFPQAKSAAKRALEADPSSGMAHALQSELLLFADRNWSQASREMETSLRLSPESSFVRSNAAWFFTAAGEHARALREARQALMAEPSSLSLLLLLGRTFMHARDYPRAITIFSKLVESNPAFYLARRYRATAYLLAGEPERAMGDLLMLPQERSEDPSFRLPMLGRAYADGGDLDRAGEVYRTLLERASVDYVVRWNVAIVAVALGRTEEAFEQLERAVTEHESTVTFISSLPWFERIEQSPRFKALVRSVGP
jgi:DNA-binding winged helix-turn-helix (wHTH) protein/Flp pilus assembly protein TadD